jgi:hypothetical protein
MGPPQQIHSPRRTQRCCCAEGGVAR